MAGATGAPYIDHMDLATIWDSLLRVISQIPNSGLLLATVGAIALSWLGSALMNREIGFGRFLRGASSVALVAIFAMVMLQVSRFDPRYGMAVPELGLPEQVVEGGETRIAMGRDGHFWIGAQVNGQRVNFMVDTGATLTAVSASTAERIGLEPRVGGIPIMLKTANGTISAEIGTADELKFGNVVARGLDTVIVPNLGETNVIGMNLLSRLASWRVEGQTLILVPNNPQPEGEWVEG
jgi:aspartyl protease family protein